MVDNDIEASHAMQSLKQSPGFNLLSFYDFRGAAAPSDVQYTKRWPETVEDNTLPCCFPGALTSDQLNFCLKKRMIWGTAAQLAHTV